MQPPRILFLLLGALLAALAAAPGAAAKPACGEPPEIVGNTIYGTPCADFIPPPPRGVTVVNGEGGGDVIFGGRGNDHLNGGEGDDRLYGGIGDDQLRGGLDDDRLSGGFGADSLLDGEAGDDLVRGDATIDDIQNSGGGTDTLSYATGVTPGFFDRQGEPHFFPDFSVYDNFPQTVEGRGAYVNLETGVGDNGRAPDGGGFDEEVDTADFEVVIGSAFPDYIVGTDGDQVFYGGGGADVILGQGGDDEVHGGAEGDYCAEASGTTLEECEFSGGDEEVDPRDPGTVSGGAMTAAGLGPPALYLTGSDGPDELVASWSSGQTSLTADGSTIETFTGAPDSVVLAGLDGDDTLTASGFPATTSVVLLGGDGGDDLSGGETEDALVDGQGDDTAGAGGGDDAVTNIEGVDDLDAGPGEDLFVSDDACGGDSLDGGPDRDNANWANFKQAVAIDMDAATVGLVGTDGLPECGAEPLTTLAGLEDIEGSGAGDVLIGDPGPNQLLGRSGPDRYFAAAGDDSILANSGFPGDDPDPTIDCGEGEDSAQIDHPENGPDAAPVGCESVEERDPNSFRPPDTPVDPNPPPPDQAEPPLPPVLRDRAAPQTRILRRPARLVLSSRPLRRIVFVFAASEPGRFLCKLDRRAWRGCGSIAAYRLRVGPHVLRVRAVDTAGNRDRTPAMFRFRIRRR